MRSGFDVNININPQHYFRLINGRILKNLHELANALKSIDDAAFKFHVNENGNHFGNWVRDVFKDEALANSIFSSKTREEMLKAVESRLMAKDESQNQEKGPKSKASGKSFDSKKLVKSYPFVKNTARILAQKPLLAETAKETAQKELPFKKIEEILMKEKEIGKREEKIEEIEARIEKELAELAAAKEPRVFSKETIQGFIIGFLLALIIGLVYTKFFL